MEITLLRIKYSGLLFSTFRAILSIIPSNFIYTLYIFSHHTGQLVKFWWILTYLKEET